MSLGGSAPARGSRASSRVRRFYYCMKFIWRVNTSPFTRSSSRKRAASRSHCGATFFGSGSCAPRSSTDTSRPRDRKGRLRLEVRRRMHLQYIHLRGSRQFDQEFLGHRRLGHQLLAKQSTMRPYLGIAPSCRRSRPAMPFRLVRHHGRVARALVLLAAGGREVLGHPSVLEDVCHQRYRFHVEQRSLQLQRLRIQRARHHLRDRPRTDDGAVLRPQGGADRAGKCEAGQGRRASSIGRWPCRGSWRTAGSEASPRRSTRGRIYMSGASSMLEELAGNRRAG